jgi:hypothetical protein
MSCRAYSLSLLPPLSLAERCRKRAALSIQATRCVRRKGGTGRKDRKDGWKEGRKGRRKEVTKEGRNEGRDEGRKEGRKTERKAGRQAGMKAGRKDV